MTKKDKEVISFSIDQETSQAIKEIIQKDYMFRNRSHLVNHAILKYYEEWKKQILK